MSDRELMEMAAKAEGRPAPWDSNDVYTAWVGDPETGHWWNPLCNDGDALRLAIKLDLCVAVNGMFVHADCRHRDDDLGYFEENTARNDGCIFKSTRLVIVRAAAAIGELIK